LSKPLTTESRKLNKFHSAPEQLKIKTVAQAK